MQITTINNANYHAFAPYLHDIKEDGCGYLGVIEDGQAIAAGAFSMEWPVLIIKNLYVAPDYRRRGAAKLLVEAAAEAAGVEIYDSIAYYDGEESLTSFLTGIGFTCVPGDGLFSIPMKSVFTCKQYRMAKKKGVSRGVIPIDSLGVSERNKLIAMAGTFYFREKLFEKGAYDPQISFASFSRGREPEGFLLASTRGRDVYVSAVAAAGTGQTAAAKLFAALAEELETVDTAERYLYFLGRNIQLVQSLQSVFGDDLKRMATGWSAIRNSHWQSGKEGVFLDE